MGRHRTVPGMLANANRAIRDEVAYVKRHKRPAVGRGRLEANAALRMSAQRSARQKFQPVRDQQIPCSGRRCWDRNEGLQAVSGNRRDHLRTLRNESQSRVATADHGA